ncbi:MAG: HAMP domain-containing histidine kinase [Actinobacteria bacterium]|nr:HAMP domain-containing histidine kinase [Actinomycetota bacterium]
MSNPPGDSPGVGSALALRLALAFLAVALAAVALLAILTAGLAAADVSTLLDRQRTELTKAVAVATADVWKSDPRRVPEDLGPVIGLARRLGTGGAEVQVRDTHDRVIASSSRFSGLRHARQYQAPVVAADGTRYGMVLTRFTSAGLARPDNALQSALLRAIAGAAGLAALVALVTALVIARRITGPVSEIIAVTRAMSRGERSARVGQVRAPGELRELATAFDGMADTLDRQEQLRRDLVADVAHELRTPVAILQAGHEALLDGVARPTPEQLASLRDEVLRLGRMVTDLQELAAADAAALQLTLLDCNLADVAALAANSLAGRFEAAGIAVERLLQPAVVRADRRWLHQIITNLLTNALKYTPAGGTVTIAVEPDGAHAVLTVTDTGAGIPADELPHIFERFWRGRQPPQTSGTGIGLAIAAELASAHGGSLTARSEPGAGTTMTLTLPRD